MEAAAKVRQEPFSKMTWNSEVLAAVYSPRVRALERKRPRACISSLRDQRYRCARGHL